MSHEITATDSMFSVRQMPWHKLGTVLDEYPTRAAAQQIAHPWEPVGEPAYRKVTVVGQDGFPVEEFVKSDTTMITVRSDNGFELGHVGPKYVPITNSEMWDIAEAIQGDGVEAKFETAGSLQGGRRVWIMLQLDEPIILKGDVNGGTLQNYVLHNAHDGTSSFKGSATATRVVCANTLRIADMDAKARGTEFSFRHSSNVRDRIDEARNAIAGWRDSVAVWQQISELLLTEKVSSRGVDAYLDHFIPNPEERVISDRVRGNIEAARGQWNAIYNGITGEGIDGTAYGLVQATSEYMEHYQRAKDGETRFARAILDRNAMVTRSIKWAREAALV